MSRDLSTPVRRMKDCRIMYRPLRMPTLIAYPPPAPEPSRARPPIPVARVEDVVDVLTRTPVARAPSRRRRRDCVFIPDMDIALAFIEARRGAEKAAAIRARQDQAAAGLPRMTLDAPVVLGLLMTFVPPLAVTLLWSSRRFSRTAQIALTAYGALMTTLLAAIAIAALT